MWKNHQPSPINNRNLACTRLYSLQRKFKRYPSLAAKYKQTINAYINKGHTETLTENQSKTLTSITNYIPHYGVTNVNKPGKVMVTYDEAEEFNNTSLNKILLKGPDLLNNFIDIFLRFRRGRYAVMIDIKQMFHQIYVCSKDRDAFVTTHFYQFQNFL